MMDQPELAGTRVLFICNPASGHVGAHLLEAAKVLGLTVELCDMREAYGRRVPQSLNWRLRGRLPSHLGHFSKQVLQVCRRFQPDLVLTTGTAPLHEKALRQLRGLGARVVNYSCDDPWSPAGRAEWFLAGLPLYDTVYNPRRANTNEFLAAGCYDVQYLPFAYSPTVHRPVQLTADEVSRYSCDAAFVGSADEDRVPLMAALAAAGVRLRLYGRYWDRYPETRASAEGPIAGDLAGRAVTGARVAPCLVRRVNRDGHSMRTFELAAVGACMVVEATDEHRDIFGEDGDCVRYFSTEQELVAVLLELLRDDVQRKTLQARIQQRMSPDHTYEARLKSMLRGSSRP